MGKIIINTSAADNIIDYVYEDDLDLTKGFNNGILNPVIADKLTKNPKALTQKEFDYLVLTVNSCKFNTIGAACAKETYVLNQYRKLIDLQNADAVSASINNGASDVKSVKAEVVSAAELTNEATNANGNYAIGTLILPHLYIRWGTTVIHNTFPSFNLDDNSPQIRDNVSSMELSFESAGSGADATGSSGNVTAGVSSCTLTLNPQLVDSTGKAITINTDGAELLVIYGYGNSNQVRALTFAQVGVKDSYFNTQQTTVSFRGIEWKITRLSEQKRYGGGKWIDKINEVSLEVCKGLGYEAANCIVKVVPEGFASDALIGETIQSSNAYKTLTSIVETTQGCKLTGGANSDALSEDLHGKYTLTIDCSTSIKEEISTPAAIALVDRALWLGQALAENVELSDVGDSANAASNTGGNCGGSLSNRPVRPKNSILVDFTQACDYRLLRPNQIKNQAPNRANEYVLELELNGSKAVPLLSPFNGTVISVNSTCKSTSTADKTCNNGRGNSVTIKSDSTEGKLKDLSWTFYYMASVSVAKGAKVSAGSNLGTQGSSGEPDSELTGISLSVSDAILSIEQSEPIINEYIQTITFSCAKVGSGCSIAPFQTSNDVNSAKYHLHYHIKGKDLDLFVNGFDNMATSDSGTCYNLNDERRAGYPQTGENTCWDPTWDKAKKEKMALTCWQAHRRGKPVYENNYQCDFFICEKNASTKTNGGACRAHPSIRNRAPHSPHPEMYYRFVDIAAAGMAVVFFPDKDKPSTNVVNIDGNGVAQIFHGDRSAIKKTAEIGKTYGPCSVSSGSESSDTNKFLTDTAKAKETSPINNGTVSASSNTTTTTTTTLCGKPGKYAATDAQLKALNVFCKANNCNPKDIAAFINAECSWNINAVNPDSKCAGLFQCCPGQAPEAQMKKLLRAKGITWFNNCSSLIGQPVEQQLEAYLVYTQVSPGNAEFNNFCQLYTQIALPAFVDDIRKDPNTLLSVACKRNGRLGNCSQFMDNAWFRGSTLENASLSGICKYGATSAIEDSRGILEGGCSFSGGNSTGLGTSGSSSNGGDCSSSSDNRSLNSRNTGTLSTGGLQNLKFRQEIKLDTEFGLNPRNIFLGPVSVDGLPQYILLANMDNSPGFVDFKIRSATLSYNGSWRWNVSAYRPADSVTYELPLTLPQPRSLNEFIEYYWYPDLQKNGDQLSPPGERASFNVNNGTLSNPLLQKGAAALPDQTRNVIDEFFKTVDTDFRTNVEAKEFTDETITKLNDLVKNEETGLLKLCRAKQSACIDYVNDNLKRFNANTELRRLVKEGEISLEFNVWVKREITDPLTTTADISATAQAVF